MNLITPIAVGNTAKIYLHGNQIVKVFHDYFSQEEAIKEAAKQEAARESGLTIPSIIDVTKIDENPAIIMEYVKGKTLGDLLMENRQKAEYYMTISVDIQLNIHEVKLNSIEPMELKLKRQIYAAQRLSESDKTKLLAKLDLMSYEARLCHGDYHLFNLILSDDHVFIIDWVDASIGDIRADVCRTYLLYSQLEEDLAELYLNLYCNKSGISQEEILEWAPIIAGARLSEIVPKEDAGRLLRIVQGD
ncbi:phosphotransferase family protein [Paucisalibacillus sp. EB02]|uniref:phosphotransferase family protein n=1 Tax=Paucisalibacillus sp. EB02 TaxID=1347087 RepID=UPI0005A8EDCA|nr:aminoglycoside phosphotransferase family protein [Paucisalibacillus sp. EB02]